MTLGQRIDQQRVSVSRLLLLLRTVKDQPPDATLIFHLHRVPRAHEPVEVPAVAERTQHRCEKRRFCATFACTAMICQDRLATTVRKTQTTLNWTVTHMWKESSRLLQENGHFVEFFLCLSQACLGEMITFSIKWRKRRPVSDLYSGIVVPKTTWPITL